METPIGYRQSKARNSQDNWHPHHTGGNGTEDWQRDYQNDIRKEEKVVTSYKLQVTSAICNKMKEERRKTVHSFVLWIVCITFVAH